MKENDGEFSICGRVEQDGVIAIGMKAASDAGVRWLLEAQALACEGDATGRVGWGQGWMGSRLNI